MPARTFLGLFLATLLFAASYGTEPEPIDYPCGRQAATARTDGGTAGAALQDLSPAALRSGPTSLDLNTLIGDVSRDSLQAWLETLENWHRLRGTPDNDAARDWLVGRFQSFGYDSILLDSFYYTINQGNGLEIYNCQNIYVYKPGTTYPRHTIIVGAHRDAYEGSPGADDNGSGTAGVLEVARILADVDTKVTIMFALWDAEEEGMYGSEYRANWVHYSGDNLVTVFNMDMIGNYENDTLARVDHGPDSTFGVLLRDLADSLDGIGLTCTLTGYDKSDYYPFYQYGYGFVNLREYDFSPVYHSYNDSTAYVSFDYVQRMVKAELATVYSATELYQPPPELVLAWPDSAPAAFCPGRPVPVVIEIEEYAGAMLLGVELHYAVDGGPYASIPMAPDYGTRYKAYLPSQVCGSRVRFFVTAEEATGGTYRLPADGSEYSAAVATRALVVFADDFSTDQGWTVVGGDQWNQRWERAHPQHGGFNGDPPTDQDSSDWCYVTANNYYTDLDNGLTSLRSPLFTSLSGETRADYARWYSNHASYQTPDDTFRVLASDDNGTSWDTVEVVADPPECEGGWYERSFWLSDVLDSPSSLRLRFDASDWGEESRLEAGVDAVRLVSHRCGPCGDVNHDGSSPNVADLTCLVDYLFKGGPPPPIPGTGDIDADGAGPNVADLTYFVNYLFKGGPPPPC